MLDSPPLPPSKAQHRILTVDDHPTIHVGIRQILSELPEVEFCGQAVDAEGALAALEKEKPDIVLLDISLPDQRGTGLLTRMLAVKPDVLILMLSVHHEAVYALKALRAGARGYIDKRDAPDILCDAIRKVVAGEIFVSPRFRERLVFREIWGSSTDLGIAIDRLSPRELEIFQMLGRGLRPQAIAIELEVSVKTVETHFTHLREKLHIGDLQELMQISQEWLAATEDPVSEPMEKGQNPAETPGSSASRPA